MAFRFKKTYKLEVKPHWHDKSKYIGLIYHNNSASVGGWTQCFQGKLCATPEQAAEYCRSAAHSHGWKSGRYRWEEYVCEVRQPNTNTTAFGDVVYHLTMLTKGLPTDMSHEEALKRLTAGLQEVRECLDGFRSLGEDESRAEPYAEEIAAAEKLLDDTKSLVP